MIVDAHVHLIHERDDLLPDALGTVQTGDDWVRMMGHHGISASVVFGNPFYWDPVRENDRVAAAVAKYPAKLIPIALINPRFGDAAMAEINRCITGLGFRGIKIRPDSYACPANAPVMRAVAEQARRLDVPLLVHTGRTHWAHPLAVGDLARDHPHTQIVMQHMFDLAGKYALKVATDCPNVMLETSGCLGVPFIREVVETIGSRRVMFGSDAPALSVALELEKIKRAKLASADEHGVLYRTAATLWGLDATGAVR